LFGPKQATRYFNEVRAKIAAPASTVAFDREYQAAWIGTDPCSAGQARLRVGAYAPEAWMSLHPCLLVERPEPGNGVRVKRHKAHVILYRVTEAEIVILRVRHGREDWVSGD
jgi:plasmid stabilization system protein ParE